jgi:CheY-like chemotaxis protein
MIKILIADDQELIRQSLLIILNSVEDFYVTDTAADGEEVIRSVKREKPDVILMDIRMPTMDGLEATQRLRRMGFALPIIAMTANVTPQDRQAALDAGMNAFAEKPIFVDKLFAAIRECLEA